ncbi:MFS transporter [Nocardioides sp. YIM 152315]|uniref:MFS transporter n=1 Tax=Nocardioides sp. YIM 152315 TaxID=3031760 RepID=UPI0023DA0AC7|nr:MFS transporter [Nocardioides sp. YIM 152315]MDF1605857.1 MFS transporter [Nocardioides sp. YIM 152315]
MSETVFRGRSVGACYVAMAVVGLLLSVYGPIVAVLQNRFEVTTAAVGSALGVQSFGAVIGVLAAQKLLRARGNRVTVSTALFLICVGAIAMSMSSSWSVMLAGAAVAGLGFGGVDSVITQIILMGSGTRGPTRVNIAHGCFGLGTFAGPALIYVVGAEHYQWVFAAAAAVSAAAAVGARGLEGGPSSSATGSLPRTEPVPSDASARPPLLAAVMAGFFVLYVTHFAVQAGIGNWGPVVLVQQSELSESHAVLAISGFWLTMVVGRFGAAALSNQVTPRVLVTVSSAGLVIVLAFSLLPAGAPWSFLAAGLFLGPIFPTGLAWLASSGYGGGNNPAYVMAGSMLGLAVAPSAVGMVIQRQGPGAAPGVLFTVALVVLLSSGALLALAAAARRVHRLA